MLEVYNLEPAMQPERCSQNVSESAGGGTSNTPTCDMQALARHRACYIAWQTCQNFPPR